MQPPTRQAHYTDHEARGDRGVQVEGEGRAIEDAHIEDEGQEGGTREKG